MANKAVFFLAVEHGIDWVAEPVFKALNKLHKFEEMSISIDGYNALKLLDKDDNEFIFVRTNKVVCHDYNKYLDFMNSNFSNFDVAGLITWHEGHNAPDKIFSVHTTGDVDSGFFGKANPQFMHNLLISIENNRLEMGLEDFRITTEATHWSGIMYGGGDPDMIVKFPVPIMDIEIGSTEESWGNPDAALVLAKSITSIFKNNGDQLKNILCTGGTHFDMAFSGAALITWGDHAFGISHIIPNQWLVTGGYETSDGLDKLETCISSIEGGIKGIAMHDGLKGAYKEQMRILGRKFNIPVFKHQMLRKPEDIQWTS